MTMLSIEAAPVRCALPAAPVRPALPRKARKVPPFTLLKHRGVWGAFDRKTHALIAKGRDYEVVLAAAEAWAVTS